MRGRGDLEVVVAPREAGHGGAPGLAAAPAEPRGGDLPGGDVGSVPAWRRLCPCRSPGPCGGGRDVPPAERSEPPWPGLALRGGSRLVPAPRLLTLPAGDGGCQRLRSRA